MKIHLKLIISILLLSRSIILAQNLTISGKVTSPTAEILPGVNILVGGTNQGTVTDSDGKYVISAPSGATLVFSYIGYVSQTISVNSRSVIDVQLVQEEKILQRS